jgi:hypothetical protein
LVPVDAPRWPVISPMPRKVITIESAFCDDTMRCSRSMSGIMRHITSSGLEPITAAAVTCR